MSDKHHDQSTNPSDALAGYLQRLHTVELHIAEHCERVQQQVQINIQVMNELRKLSEQVRAMSQNIEFLNTRNI